MAYRSCCGCGKTIAYGDLYFSSIRISDRIFCCKRCMRDWILDNDCEAIVSDWIDDNAEEYDLEADDLYGRYGISRGDFV